MKQTTDFSPQSLTLYDPCPASMMDLSTQFFLRETDVTAQANRYIIINKVWRKSQ